MSASGTTLKLVSVLQGSKLCLDCLTPSTDKVVTSPYRFVSNLNCVMRTEALIIIKRVVLAFMENQILLKPVNLVLVSTASTVHVAIHVRQPHLTLRHTDLTQEEKP